MKTGTRLWRLLVFAAVLYTIAGFLLTVWLFFEAATK